MAKDKVHTETVEVEGDHLLAKIKEIVHEGNVSLPDYYLHPLQPLRMVAGTANTLRSVLATHR